MTALIQRKGYNETYSPAYPSPIPKLNFLSSSSHISNSVQLYKDCYILRLEYSIVSYLPYLMIDTHLTTTVLPYVLL